MFPDTEHQYQGETKCHGDNDMGRSPRTKFELEQQKTLEILLVSTPLNPEKKKGETTDRQNASNVIDARENLAFR